MRPDEDGAQHAHTLDLCNGLACRTSTRKRLEGGDDVGVGISDEPKV
jgi:hypothetical protein